MSNPVETIDYKGFKIKIFNDEDVEKAKIKFLKSQVAFLEKRLIRVNEEYN